MSGMGGHSGTQWCGWEGGRRTPIEDDRGETEQGPLLADKTPIFQDQVLDEIPMLDKPNTLLCSVPIHQFGFGSKV